MAERREAAAALVGRDHRAPCRDRVIDHLQHRGGRAIAEQPLALAQHHREGHQHQPVNQAGGEQRRIEGARSLHDEIGAVVLFERSDIVDAFQSVAVRPCERLVAACQHVLIGTGERLTHRRAFALHIGPIERSHLSLHMTLPPPCSMAAFARRDRGDAEVEQPCYVRVLGGVSA